MILTEKVIIELKGTQGKYYNNLGYNCKNGDVIEVDYKNKNYPSIDHKISLFYGFNNDIPPETIVYNKKKHKFEQKQ